MTQSGYDITIEGNCLTLTALSDFVGALEHSRYFARPVEIIIRRMDLQHKVADTVGVEIEASRPER